MNEASSLASQLIFGQDVTGSTPETSTDSPVESQDKSTIDLASDLLGLPPLGAEQEEPEAEDQPEVSEESKEVEEELPEESADDTTPIEEPDNEEIEELSAPDEVLDLEAMEGIAIPIPHPETGEVKHYTLDQVVNQFNRYRSASTKSQEAKEQLAAIEQEREQLVERESRLESLDLSNGHQREMVLLDAQYRQAQEQLGRQDLSDADYRQLTTYQAQVQERFSAVQQEYNNLQSQLSVEIPSSVSEYASSKLSQQSMQAAQKDPAMLDLIEKAQKWEQSQQKIAKSKPKLKAKKATTKGSSSNVQDPVTAKHEAAQKRAKQGMATDDDMSLLRGNVMGSILGDFGQ